MAGETLRPGGLDLTRRALELTALQPGSLVADIGCGPGATARLLATAGHQVLALDLSEIILLAAQGPGITAIRATAKHLPLPSQSLDAVFCECVLSVADSTDDGETAGGGADKVLAEAARALRPGGALVISDLYLRTIGRTFSQPAAGAGSCLSGARGQAELMAGLVAAGLHPFVFEDHSRLLAELAARLIFAGMSPHELAGGCRPGPRPGYFLCLARKLSS
ncbi:MAG: class I SAM-dependent methyltransferase [Humidesulfovibrio sp.]|nr:class I SAM-dependent methyltransferase [Humidesulfovibrio sp.]